jgi:hypothetical protein
MNPPHSLVNRVTPRDGAQQADAEKLGEALVKMRNRPKQFHAGSDAVAVAGPTLDTPCGVMSNTIDEKVQPFTGRMAVF